MKRCRHTQVPPESVAVPIRTVSHIRGLPVLVALSVLAGCPNSAPPPESKTGGSAERLLTSEEYSNRASGAYSEAAKQVFSELQSKGHSSYVLIDKADTALARAANALRVLDAAASGDFRAVPRNAACSEAFKEISVAYVPIDIFDGAGLIEPSPALYPEGRAALARMRQGKQSDLLAWGSMCLQPK